MPVANKVAVVIVNYNGYEYTKECIESVLKSDYLPFKVVLVDNGSNDGSGDELKKDFGDLISYIKIDKNGGVTGGNNAGMDYALKNGFDSVMFLNNDALINYDTIKRMVATSEENSDALVVPKIMCFFDPQKLDHFIGPDYDWSNRYPVGYEYYPKEAHEHNVRADIRVASTCCLLVPVAALPKIGTMDENYFMYYDDSDFTIRAVRAGFRMIYEPKAVVRHKCNMTTKNKQPSYFEYYLQNRNVFYFYNKLCPDRRIKIVLFAKILLSMALDLVKAVVKRDAKRIRVIFRIFSDIAAKRMGPPPDMDKI